jgi:hypothetical protein
LNTTRTTDNYDSDYGDSDQYSTTNGISPSYATRSSYYSKMAAASADYDDYAPTTYTPSYTTPIRGLSTSRQSSVCRSTTTSATAAATSGWRSRYANKSLGSASIDYDDEDLMLPPRFNKYSNLNGSTATLCNTTTNDSC